MSGKGPKKETDSKIKFFEIDDQGEIAPAFPKEGEETNAIRQEPLPLNEFESIPNINQMFPEENAKEPSASPQIDEQLDILKPQIETLTAQEGKLSDGQVDVLKKYLSLKEAEVRDLRDQHRQYEGFLKKLSAQLETYAQRNRELISEAETLKARDTRHREELREMKEKHQGEVMLLRSDFDEKLRSSGNYDAQAEDLHRKKEEFREKVKEDLKRIKLKERELENKYELLKRDTQALLDSKDKHTLELKKKNDAFELEMEALEDRLRKSTLVLGSIEAKKKRLIETMKLAIGLLENIDQTDDSPSEDERKAG